MRYVDAEHKLQLPLGHFDFQMERSVTTRDDGLLPARDSNGVADHSNVLDLLRDLTRFGRNRS